MSNYLTNDALACPRCPPTGIYMHVVFRQLYAENTGALPSQDFLDSLAGDVASEYADAVADLDGGALYGLAPTEAFGSGGVLIDQTNDPIEWARVDVVAARLAVHYEDFTSPFLTGFYGARSRGALEITWERNDYNGGTTTGRDQWAGNLNCHLVSGSLYMLVSDPIDLPFFPKDIEAATLADGGYTYSNIAVQKIRLTPGGGPIGL